MNEDRGDVLPGLGSQKVAFIEAAVSSHTCSRAPQW